MECKRDDDIVSSEFVVSGRDTPALLDRVEESLDQVASAIAIKIERACPVSDAIRTQSNGRCYFAL